MDRGKSVEGWTELKGMYLVTAFRLQTVA